MFLFQEIPFYLRQCQIINQKKEKEEEKEEANLKQQNQL
jgi:hypothetical protein